MAKNKNEMRAKSIVISILNVSKSGVNLKITAEYEGCNHLLKEEKMFMLAVDDTLKVDIIKIK